MLEKTFDFKRLESEIYHNWEENSLFKPKNDELSENYSIVIPPPNVTGSLHMGHALNNTLQDIIVRYQRMLGKSVLWLPGTDHAGIATQMVVEKKMALNHIKRQDLGREEFINKVWEWKSESGGTIVKQLRKLGASCDWSRERFTLDEGLSAAVIKVFNDLYKDGLIYKDRRLVNWDPHFQTAISDLEVEQIEVDGAYYHMRYRLDQGLSWQKKLQDENGEDYISEFDYIVVATTRPETFFGDVAIAVHPENDLYKHLIGKHAYIPIIEKKIPIIADIYADPEKGTGAVKITPAHDFNDFIVAKRHNLVPINIMTKTGHLSDVSDVATEFQGLERFLARKKIIERAQEDGWLGKIEKIKHTVPHGDRSGVVIEPLLTEQWFVNAKQLSEKAILAVEEGECVFIPKNWENTYFEWMRNIQPWCISRQLWWGHQIPAWYGPDNEYFVAMSLEEAQEKANLHYGKFVELKRDPDVLDTWFSSALWPFSTMGWPEKSQDYDKFYPTNTLVTGFDIIFFWVARMMMMGIYCTKKVPFKHVFINALVLDEKGQKMSKSKGNVMDPLDLIEQYGADPLRFTMAAMSGQGRDIRLSKQRIEGYRNFSTKLWNAARFLEHHNCSATPLNLDPSLVKYSHNRWIISELQNTLNKYHVLMQAYGFDDVCMLLYKFIWNSYCDWYLEIAKIIFKVDDASINETKSTASLVFQVILEMLHPIMPFVTEELWKKNYISLNKFLMTKEFSTFKTDLTNFEINKQYELFMEIISEIRSLRNEFKIPVNQKLNLYLISNPDVEFELLHSCFFAEFAKAQTIDIIKTRPNGTISFILSDYFFCLDISEFIDINLEIERLQKEINSLKIEEKGLNAKLGNSDFISRAPKEIVDETKQRLSHLTNSKTRLLSVLSDLGGVIE